MVVHANAGIDPWAVMIHVKDTSVTAGTVMASFRLEDIAHKAVVSSLVLWISQVETPKHRHLAWICDHCLEKRPQKHEKDHMIEY